jgi:hypothetical protein
MLTNLVKYKHQITNTFEGLTICVSQTSQLVHVMAEIRKVRFEFAVFPAHLHIFQTILHVLTLSKQIFIKIVSYAVQQRFPLPKQELLPKHPENFSRILEKSETHSIACEKIMPTSHTYCQQVENDRKNSYYYTASRKFHELHNFS